MKKILLIMLLFVFPFNAYALEGSMIVDCDKTTVNPGGTITCTLKGTVSGDTVSGISANIATSNSEVLALGDVTINNSLWLGDGKNGDVDLYTDSNKSGTFEIATFTLNVSNSVISGADVDILISDNVFSDSNFKDETIDTVTQKIRIASLENGLTTLSLYDGTLSPVFDKDTLNYSATVNQEHVTIVATAIDSKAKVSGNVGDVSLKYGNNTFKVKVTSESNSTKIYTINITRPDTRDTINTISSLKLNDKNITLDNDKSEYNMEVENNVTELKIEAILASEKASFVDGYAPRNVKLSEGKNTIEIRVMAENETVKTYAITVNRKAKEVVKDNNNDNNATTNDNSNNNKVDKNNPSNQNELTNPKTGISSIFFVILIFVVSIVVIIVSYKKYLKKEGKDNE